MISFEVFNEGRAVQDISGNSTYMFGQDEIAARSQLEFQDGLLRSVRHGDGAVGIATLWPAGDCGKVMLQTTRLPARQKPYNLNVEIARGRLLRISQKREEWGAADWSLSPAHHGLIDAALDKFIQALCYLKEPARAAGLADESLALSVRAGEEIALAYSNSLIARRSESQGFGRHCFGCCFDPNRIKDAKYLQHIKDNFHFVTIPISWRQIEEKEHARNFDVLDECVNWLGRNRIAIKVGPLLTFSPEAVPDWLYIWEHDFDQVREMAYDYVTTVVERYSRKVQAWDVISGLNVNNCFNFSFEQVVDMTSTAVLAAKRSSSRSLVLVEVCQLWGGYYVSKQYVIPPLTYIDMICQSGMSFDGIGLNIGFGRGINGMQVRDMFELSVMLDKVSVFGKPIHLSCVQVPSGPDSNDKSGQGAEAGCWHGPWTQQSQAEWLDQFYRIALSKPAVETVTWRDLADRDDGILQAGGLLQKDLGAKTAFEHMIRTKERLIQLKRGGKEAIC